LGSFSPGCWCGAISPESAARQYFHLPLVLPPVVVGYLLLIAMGRRGFIGSWLYDWFGLSFAFSWRGAVLAAAVMSFPLMVRAIRLALEGVDIKLEQAARTLGAGRWRVFFTITLPLTLPGIIVGTVLAFARSLGSLAPPSPLSPIFPAKRAPFLRRCIP
jgi:ABC-type molybdate transport system permease subunit